MSRLTTSDLASLLRKETVPAARIRVGDVIVPSADFRAPWRVARILDEPGLRCAGLVGLYDTDDDGCDVPLDASITIVARSALAESRSAEPAEPTEGPLARIRKLAADARRIRAYDGTSLPPDWRPFVAELAEEIATILESQERPEKEERRRKT